MRWLAAFLTLLLTCAIPVLGGFIWFLNLIPAPETLTGEMRAGGVPRCAAVVVWTGAAGRIDAGADLLAAGAAPRLFISGVGEQVALADFRADLVDDPRVSLGHQAHSTLGNAFETAGWVRREGVASVCLVTSDYHMPRSVLLLKAEAPDLALRPWPVASETGNGTGRLAFLWKEYVKFAASHFAVETRTRGLLHDLAETARGTAAQPTVQSPSLSPEDPEHR